MGDMKLYEKDLAEQLGVGRQTISAVRTGSMTKGTHFEQDAGGTYYLPAGLDELGKLPALREAISRLKKISAPPAQDGGQGPAVDSAAPSDADGTPPIQNASLEARTEVLKVSRIFSHNRQLVRATLPDGSVVRVKLTNSMNLIAGMEFRCRHLDGDLWKYEGPLPRYRGRWGNRVDHHLNPYGKAAS
jgi:hypothetical protein